MTSDRVRIGLLFQVFRTSQVIGRFVSRALEPVDLKGDEYAVYSYLLHGPMTLTELADGTGLPLTTAADWVRRFVDRGHLEKVPNPDDGRSRLLQLTPGTREWILDAARVFTKTVDTFDAVLADEGLDSAELVAALLLIQHVAEASLDDLDRPLR